MFWHRVVSYVVTEILEEYIIAYTFRLQEQFLFYCEHVCQKWSKRALLSNVYVKLKVN